MDVIKDLLLALWRIVQALTTVAFAVALVLLVAFAALVFFEWFFAGKLGRTTSGSSAAKRAILFSRLGAWVQSGCSAFAANWPALVMGSVVACAVSVISFGVLAGPMTVGLSRMCLKSVRETKPQLSVGMLWNGFNSGIQSIAFVVAQLLLAFSGVYVLRQLGSIGALSAGLYVALLQTMMLFGVFFIADHNANAIKATFKSARAVSAAPFVFLLLWAIAAALGNVGAVFFMFGALVTLPLQLCVLASAFNECQNSTVTT